MKFVLLNPNDPPSIKVEREMAGNMGTVLKKDKHSDLHYFFPMMVTYTISALLDENCDFKFIDGQTEILDENNLIETVLQEKPDILFSLISLTSVDHDIALLKTIKELLPRCDICVLGGPCNVMPEYILQNKHIDYLIQGRYPYYNHIREFCYLAQNNDSIQKCRGLTFMKDGKLIRNEWNSENDLDKLNFRSFHLINIQKYIQTTWFPDNTSVSYVTILPSVGCYYNCIYCPYPLTYGNKLVMKDMQRLLEEIEYFINTFQVSGFYLRSIAIDKERKWLFDFCNAVINKKLDIQWIIEARVDQMDEEIVSLMSRAGCIKIDFGVETGSEKLLKSIGKPGLDKEKIYFIFRLCKKIGIFPMAQLIIGLLGETKETIVETQRLLEQIDPVSVNFHICIPYPGTRLYELAKNNGFIEDFNYAHYISHTAVMRTEELGRNDLERYEKRMRKRLMMRQFLQNKYHRKRILKLISHKIIAKF